MAAANYPACLAVTLRWESGFSDHPADPGGATMRGVTQGVYDGYRVARGLTRRTVQKIEETELQAIYRRQYWDVVRGDDLPPGLDLAVFDYAVNSGPMRAVKALQVVLRMNAVDGHLGEATLGAIRGHTAGALVAALCDRRLAFMKAARDKRGRRLWPTFGRGWTNRLAAVRPAALAMARGEPAPDQAREPLPAPPDVEVDPAGKAVDAAPPAPATDKAIALGTAGAGALAAIVGAIQSPWGVAALAILVVAAGLAAWRLWPRARMPEMGP